MGEKVKLTAGIFVAIATIGLVWFISSEDSGNLYLCNDDGKNITGLCWKLSSPNLLNVSTRCYYNQSSPSRYKVCNTGWISFTTLEIIGNVSSNLSEGEDLIVLYENRILEESIYDCLRINWNYTGDARDFFLNWFVSKYGSKFNELYEFEIIDDNDLSDYGFRLCGRLSGKRLSQVQVINKSKDFDSGYDFVKEKWKEN